MTTDELLSKVHERLGGVGLDIATFGGNGRVEVRWRRDYGDSGLGDLREASGAGMHEALREVLAYEEWADEQDAMEARES